MVWFWIVFVVILLYGMLLGDNVATFYLLLIFFIIFLCLQFWYIVITY